MKKYLPLIIRGILAGITISLVAILYLTVLITTANKLVGSVLFSFGLITIIFRNYSLYTGKIGYLLPYKKGELLNITIVLFSNIVAVAIMGLLVKVTGLSVGSVKLSDYATNLVTTKLNIIWYQTFILSVFCGILMYIAVDSSKQLQSNIVKLLITIGAVTIFLLAGFEHSIANMFYAFLGNIFSFKLIIYIVIMILGNAVGSIMINLMHSKID